MGTEGKEMERSPTRSYGDGNESREDEHKTEMADHMIGATNGKNTKDMRDKTSQEENKWNSELIKRKELTETEQAESGRKGENHHTQGAQGGTGEP